MQQDDQGISQAKGATTMTLLEISSWGVYKARVHDPLSSWINGHLRHSLILAKWP
jgi:hypothetical protein